MALIEDMATAEQFDVTPDEDEAFWAWAIIQRRAPRPAEECREPTTNEWREFQEHFHTHKLELGDGPRPYGTPCRHEHSCLRCPMVRVSPRQRPRLIEIIRNLSERIAEARTNGWLGEVQGLQATLQPMARMETDGGSIARGRCCLNDRP
ncbi:hypothetical protein [Streptomyces sp. NBC_00328]|uniref:hypothetical protein n=1 Tax=Streptomyces sp. NBC_00328 TaxID=2903646 RepID=UPI002E29DCC5|nr:hypothetical protein [Streptomyces sp. NBC_00328]